MPVDFIFKDEAVKCETFRAAGFTGGAGADIGEVVVTAPENVFERKVTTHAP